MWVHTICVCFWKCSACKCVCFFFSSFFQKQDCDCSFVAHSCPTLGISRYSPGSKGFSEALLIGCNLLFKLESQQASSLAVYKQLMQGTPILLVTTGVYLFPLPAAPSYLISQPVSEADCLLLRRGPRCKQLLSSGAFWGRGAAGGFGLNLEVSMGMMAGFGDRRGFLLRHWWNNNAQSWRGWNLHMKILSLRAPCV